MRRRVWLMVGGSAALAIATLSIAGFGDGWSGKAMSTSATPRHGLLHINCPPGSHGRPRHDGVGAELDQARRAAQVSRSQPMAERAITGGRE